MEQEIRSLLSESLLDKSAHKLGFSKSDLSDLGGFQNFVYEAKGSSKSCIIRIAHSSHRSFRLTEAELDWVQYLFNHGVNVAAPIRSLAGNYISQIDAGDSYFITTAFDKAAGGKPHYQMYMEDKNLIQKLGRVTGRMHTLSKKYKVSKGSARRYDWKDNNYLTRFTKYIPASHEAVIEGTKKFLQGLLLLPKDLDSYGLIHGDIHHNNFHVHKDELILFDFDECEYNWFVADIANPLFYATPLPSDGRENRDRTAKRFYDYFMEGYSKENVLDEYWVKRIPLFLRLREILVLSGAFRSLDFSHLHPWSKEMIETTTLNIENDLPFVDIHFT